MTENTINNQALGNKRKRALSEVPRDNGDRAKRARSEEPEIVHQPVRRMTRKNRNMAITALKKSYALTSKATMDMSKKVKNIIDTAATQQKRVLECPKIKGISGPTKALSLPRSLKRKHEEAFGKFADDIKERPSKMTQIAQDIDADTLQPSPITTSNTALAVQNPKLARLNALLAPFALLEAEEEEQLEEMNRPGALYSFFRDEQLQSRNPSYKSDSINRYRAGADETDDANQLDPDYYDEECEYGEDPDELSDRDEDYKRRTEVDDDPDYDPEFIAKEHTSGGKIKMPSYAPPMPRQGFTNTSTQAAESCSTKKAYAAYAELKTDPNASSEYKRWKAEADTFFGKGKRAPFPKIKGRGCDIRAGNCVKGEKLGICMHDVERVLKGSVLQTEGQEWIDRLKRERNRWHSDKFAKLEDKKWIEEATDMFVMVEGLYQRAK